MVALAQINHYFHLGQMNQFNHFHLSMVKFRQEMVVNLKTNQNQLMDKKNPPILKIHNLPHQFDLTKPLAVQDRPFPVMPVRAAEVT